MPGILQRRLHNPGLMIETEFWPGWIPIFIQRPAETRSVDVWDFSPMVKGWHRFVRENWESNDGNDDSRARQRRALITTWASADQNFRDVSF